MTVTTLLLLRDLTPTQKSYVTSKLNTKEKETSMAYICFSKLPMRQLTMLERKKKPTARALIHLFPTLTQIYSCFEID